MLVRKLYIFLACFFLFSDELLSQRYPFINYTPLDGLVNNRVRSMYQDSKGRLYFLTSGGLSVYDGARFTNYTTADGLALEVVNDMLEMSPDSFWIATNTNKLNCLVNGKIKLLKTSDGFSPVINGFLRTDDGRIYAAADDGLFTWQGDRFTFLPVVYEGKEVGRFLAQIKQSGKFLLLLINPGLGEDAGTIFLYDPNTRQVLHREKTFLTYHITTSLRGDIWLAGTTGIKVLKKEKLEQGIFQVEEVPANFAAVRTKQCLFLSFDGLGQLWLSIPNEGLLVIKPGQAPVVYNEGSGLGSSRISFIFQDREGNNWFIPESRGAQKLVSNNVELIDRPFGRRSISDLYVEKESDSAWLYSPTNSELILSKGLSKKVFHTPFHPVYTAYLLARGSDLFLYDEKNIYKFEIPTTGTEVKTICHYKYSSQQIGYGNLDPNGNLIFCADNTLRVFLKDCSTFFYTLEYYSDQISFDKDGYLWVVTRSGSLRVFSLHPENPDEYLKLKYDLSSQLKIDNPRSLVVDDSNRIWIGTRFQGLYCFHFVQNRLQLLRHLTRSDGLTDNFVNYLGCDGNNTIWASSPAGLDKLKILGKQLVVENITQSNKFYVSIKKMMADKNGTVRAVGESGNLIRINEPTDHKDAVTPKFFISQIRAGQESYSGSDSLHPFSYKQNNFSFFVAAPSFYDEKQVKYRYLLRGSGNLQWSEPTAEAGFHFVNLPPGRYVLNVKAEFPAGRYPAQFLSYSFIIDPPWWQTWWFRVLLGLMIIGFFIAIVRRYYRGKFLRQRTVLEKQQLVEKERTRIATDMHDDLGAGLSRIKYLSESIQFKKANDESIINDVVKIASYSDEMVEKMGEIVWALNEKNDTLADLVAFTRSYAVDYLNTNNIQCIFHGSEELPGSFVTGEIRRNLFLSVKESLHNVVKHAGAQTVTIRVSIDNNIQFTIHDDGVGIDWNHIRPFSNGLSNILKRMEEIGGKAEIQNKGGTSITLNVPFKE